VSKKPRDTGGPSPAAPPEALDWPEGTYILVRLPTTGFRDKQSAIVEAKRRYPGAVIGQLAVVRGKWIIRVRDHALAEIDDDGAILILRRYRFICRCGKSGAWVNSETLAEGEHAIHANEFKKGM
jgi:hypothetical protein